ncbi:asparagine synthase-related protein [Roseivirga sp. E12]|uniref:asparagine synthase-related protein n=1 Tax=Roseivirga sp. E12 TaxID=2819237 RepID=UPI001ABBE623|nr:asparagine synthase-related protein [Roseivirga sp. E12]MBO3700889.1 hypothetical protein [Roseivirga sp. E12]
MRSSEFTVGVVFPHDKQSYAHSELEEDWLLMDGFAFDVHRKRLTARELLILVRENGVKYLHQLNGEFFVSLRIKGRLFFINDFMGQRQHCVLNDEDDFAIAPSPGLVLELAKREKKINHNALFVFLITRKFRYKRETIWEGCLAIEPSTEMEVSSEKVILSRYWRYEHASSKSRLNIGSLVDLYKESVNSRILESNISLTLTGGLDSRSMIGAVSPNKLPMLKGVTMGIHGCDEIRFASEVAGKLGLSYHPFHLSPEQAFETESLEYLRHEDIDLLIQGLWSPFTKALKDSSYLLHGLDLDVTLGGIYLNEDLMKVNSQGEFKNFLMVENLRLPQARLENLIKDDSAFELDIETYFNELIDGTVEGDYAESYDKMIMSQSMNRVILQRYRGIRQQQETLSPMYDRHLMEYILSLDLRDRASYKVFFPFINKLCPDLCEVPYQRTGLPPKIPFQFWKDAQRLDGQREELYRQIALKSKGRNYLEYKKYYTNVDEWMRFNKKWMAATSDLLQSDKSIIRETLINPKEVDRLINEHQRHERSNLGILHTLMSAEIFLRISESQELINHE